MEAVGEQIKLLGAEAKAKEKSESTEGNPGRELLCLGWVFLLDQWTEDVAEANRLKALWVTNLDAAVTLEVMEVMASMASRYAMVYRELSVLVEELYRMREGKNRQGRKELRHFTPLAIVAIWIWRAYLIRSEV